MSTAMHNQQSPATARLLLGVLTPPAAWGTHLAIGYLLVTVHCIAGLPGFAAWLTILTIASLGMTVWSGITAYRAWRRIGGIWQTGADGIRSRDSFLTLLGAMLSPIFGLAIIFGAVPLLTLAPCAR